MVNGWGIGDLFHSSIVFLYDWHLGIDMNGVWRFFTKQKLQNMLAFKNSIQVAILVAFAAFILHAFGNTCYTE